MKAPPPSREEIETLCILHTVGRRGCHVGELTIQLGLSTALTAAMAQAIEPFVEAGWLAYEDGCFSLTDFGQTYVESRLRQLGLG